MEDIRIAWFGKHFGEEPPLVKKGGAGTIFFTGCNLHCVYCQNYQISQEGIGRKFSIKELVETMLKLQKDGAENIDLVTPTIWFKQIKEAILIAKSRGLKIPIIWNSNGYDGADLIREMKGLVDIYLPDFKYSDNDLAYKYSGVKNYIEKAEETIKEMITQVGPENVIIRHLVLPNNIKNSIGVLKIIKKIGKGAAVSLMTQYEPVYRAKEFPEINRRITEREFKIIHERQLELGLIKGWIQEMDSQKVFLPDFTKENPFYG